MSTGSEYSEPGSTRHVHQLTGNACCLETLLDDLANTPGAISAFVEIIHYIIGQNGSHHASTSSADFPSATV